MYFYSCIRVDIRPWVPTCSQLPVCSPWFVCFSDPPPPPPPTDGYRLATCLSISQHKKILLLVSPPPLPHSYVSNLTDVLRKWFHSENIEWFIEDQAFSLSYDLVPPPPPLKHIQFDTLWYPYLSSPTQQHFIFYLRRLPSWNMKYLHSILSILEQNESIPSRIWSIRYPCYKRHRKYIILSSFPARNGKHRFWSCYATKYR